MDYIETDLVKVAKRENNTKRNYLVVNPLQGKHVPVSPAKALALFTSLADTLKGKYEGERLLLVGFAETATAIGAHVAVALGTKYIQTTRETIPGVSYLFFSEEHSHATEQKLVKDDMDIAMGQTDRIIFVEDEVTTGNTILNIIGILQKEYRKDLKFAVASILNGMTDRYRRAYEEKAIDIHYLVKTDQGAYGSVADSYVADGDFISISSEPHSDISVLEIAGRMNARRIVDAREYEKACQALCETITDKIDLGKNKRILVIGTEEFMYPALFAGSKIEGLGHEVKCHATTRSPIAVSKETDYPLHARYGLKSLYDPKRNTFLYDIGTYDKVIALTDADLLDETGLNCLVNALRMKSQDITVVRWC